MEDWEFCLRLFSKFEIGFLETPLAHYRIRQGGVGGAAENSRIRNSKIYGKLDQRIRNRYLRNDLASGKIGLGFLLNLAKMHGESFRENHEMKEIIGSLTEQFKNRRID